MRPFTRKIFGALGMAMLAVIEATFFIASLIGLTTTTDDAKANLPAIFTWLLGTPWWVPALVVPGLLCAIAAWAFWPDRSVQTAMREYKAANDRAWRFEPEFRVSLDKTDIIRTELQADFESLRAKTETMMANHLSSFSKKLDGLREELKGVASGSARQQVAAESIRIQTGLSQLCVEEVRRASEVNRRSIDDLRSELLRLEMEVKSRPAAPQ